MKCLIVDDDSVCRDLIKEIMLPYAECDMAYDGDEAIDAFRLALEDGDPYDLVCLDIMMPGTDGHGALEGIRALETAAGMSDSDATKIIMTTSVCNMEQRDKAFREGCEAYVTKPIEENVLLGEVKKLFKLLKRRPGWEDEAADMAKGADPKEQLRFLIVDDDRLCRVLLKSILSEYARCDLAVDGGDAIEKVRESLENNNPYNLICLDIMMPEVDGHEALKAFRSLEAERGVLGADGVKVIMTTALAESKHCIQAFREGCESYVTKPLDRHELLTKICQLGVLDEKQIAPQTTC